MRRNALPLLRTAKATRYVGHRHFGDTLWSSATYEKRVQKLKDDCGEKYSFPEGFYPRMPKQSAMSSIAAFNQQYKLDVVDGQGGWELNKHDVTTLNGKIQAVRRHGQNLMFIEISQGEDTTQIMSDFRSFGDYTSEEKRSFLAIIQPGDYYSFTGFPTKSTSGALVLKLSSMPKLLSPSLHQLPKTIEDEQTLARFPQLDLTLRRKKRDLLRIRHAIEMTIQTFFNSMQFTKVTTPILAADIGGAVARPFETCANEFSDRTLYLRISQELELKKLVAAGMGAIYEIGPVFRNEGIDATHNPEFTTCEFYQPYTTIDGLMRTTEQLLKALHKACMPIVNPSAVLETANWTDSKYKFQRLAFIPTIEDQIKHVAPEARLPKVLSESALPELEALFTTLNLPLPMHLSVNHLLDVLASHFIEPLCRSPTFITGYPAIMSPLAKSYTDSKTGHVVSARAELFIDGTEYVNLYEEENDPFTQTKKFLLQKRDTDAQNGQSETIDLSAPHEELVELLTPGQQYYIKVLEMGLPPTGGWGCGIERLTMLMGQAPRIADVLPFGTLRSVVAMGTKKGSDK